MFIYMGQYLILLTLLINIQFLFFYFFKKKLNTYYFFYIFIFSKCNIIFNTLIFLILIYQYIFSDFSSLNVYSHSHTAQPLIYKLGAVWGNHEGSMILWNWIISVYIFFYTFKLEKINIFFLKNSITPLIYTQLFFLLYMFLTSNPFIKSVKYRYEGTELNPILQDPGLIIHPPILYIGYLGSLLIFSMIYGYLQTINIPLKNTIQLNLFFKQIIIFCWIMLTFGIFLGSWWAYYELGWGGWWFWDPVENIALMPWLLVITFYHQYIKIDKNLIKFTPFTIILGSLIYFLSIFGTFFVRSGLLNSVHSFASDSYRGIFIILYLSFIFWNFKKISFQYLNNKIIKVNDKEEIVNNKKFFIKIKNIIFLFFTLTIFIGTFFPTFFHISFSKDISIGTAYYKDILFPATIPIILLISIVPYIPSTNLNFKNLYNYFPLKSTIIGSFITLTILYIKYIILEKLLSYSMGIFLYLLLLSFILIIFLYSYRKYSIPMTIAHIGFIFFLMSTVISSVGHTELIQLLIPGEKIQLKNKIFILKNINFMHEKNYSAFYSTIIIKDFNSKKIIGVLFPEKRFYFKKNIFNTKSSILSNYYSDIYSSLGDGNILYGWYIRFYYSPFMPYIWISGLLLLSSGFYLIYKNACIYHDLNMEPIPSKGIALSNWATNANKKKLPNEKNL